ncbi:translocation/assembly module TamB domain-containing protein [Hyphomonas sp. WL0036]|uniref:translocation/assembly module TamB domain-containing protein n=1 Tax=Hyphomonas sediminis TaxID=2866160 RepID=UPI001C8017E3|nr:translocation/assembly module TamB domain-containing protein [Hyphomonas sediminis]MBY9067677.1 translocation/assembly module TamB domain-containing protein [Hyphomonas sediminis]
MLPTFPLKDWRKRHPWLTGAILATAGGVAAISALRIWITTDSGRNFILSQIDGMDVAGYGELKVDTLKGDPLSDMTVGSIQVRNDDGVWAEAKNVRLRWSPLGLLTRKLSISELDIDTVSIYSRPVRAPRPRSEGGGSWRVHMNSLVLDQLVLADGVAGPQSTSEISARFVQQDNGALDAALRLRPIEGRGDRVDLLIVMTASQRFDITVIADAPADGIFAHMLELAPGSTARLEANGAGDLENGVAEARFSIDREDKAYLSGKLENGQLSASAKLDATALPLPKAITALLGKSAETSLNARLNGDEAHFEFDALVAEGEVHLAGLADLQKRELIGPAHVRADLASLKPFWQNGAGLMLNGELTYASGEPGYTGEVRLIADEESILPFEAASGNVTVSLADAEIPFSGNLEFHGPFPIGDIASAAIGPSPKATLSGQFNVASTKLTIDAADIQHDSGTLRLAGIVDAASGEMDLSGRLSQSISPFVPGFSGTGEGIVSLKGPFNAIDLSTNLSLRNLSGPDAMAELVNGTGTASAALRISGGEVTARMVRLRLPGVSADATGPLAGNAGLNLKVTAEQTVPLTTAGTMVNLGALQASITQPGDTILIAANSAGGMLQNGSNTVDNLAVATSLEQSGSNIDGPVRITGSYGDETVDLSALLERRSASTRIDDVAGFLGKLRVSGNALIADAGGLEADARISGSDFVFGGVEFGEILVNATLNQDTGEPLVIVLDADAKNTIVSKDTRFDRIRTNIRTQPDGYEYTARFEDATRGRETDMQVSGSASLEGDAPEGTLRLNGKVFGETISTRQDATWRLGENPELKADLSILGGSIQASLATTGASPHLEFAFDNVDAGPILSSYGAPVSAARIDGAGSFLPFGRSPTGSFDIRTSSPVTGLDGAIDLNISGKLDARMLSIDGSASYGPTLGGNFALALPVTARENEMARLNRQAGVLGNGQFKGDLEAIRQIALAYGHDVGGTIDSTVFVTGTLDAPQINAKANIKNGLYEYGAMGFRIARFDMNAAFENSALTVDAVGQGPDGGNIKASGRLDEKRQGQVGIELRRLLVYDRNSDKMRLSGNAALTETDTARIISGKLNVDEANFSLDNLPAASARRLDVRWREDITDEPEDPVLEKPIRFDMLIQSDRRIFIDGRGLDSEWGVNVNVTGSPAAPLLNGRATLVRGQLELARRPFVFDTGVVTFDGPVDSARVDISAERQVDSFTAEVNVTGSPGSPRIELSSTPELPQDEILARMLFGRSVMDLSALEAAELATSIARLSGQGGGLDPLGQIQAGLGLDRLRLGVSDDGNTELGVGQYLAPEVYLEITTAGASGNSVEVEWQPKPQISVTSEARSTGESRVSVRWKRDY